MLLALITILEPRLCDGSWTSRERVERIKATSQAASKYQARSMAAAFSDDPAAPMLSAARAIAALAFVPQLDFDVAQASVAAETMASAAEQAGGIDSVVQRSLTTGQDDTVPWEEALGRSHQLSFHPVKTNYTEESRGKLLSPNGNELVTVGRTTKTQRTSGLRMPSEWFPMVAGSKGSGSERDWLTGEDDDTLDWEFPKRTLWRYGPKEVSAVDIVSGMPCATEPQHVQVVGKNVSEPIAARFYVHSEGPLDFSDRERCIIETVGKTNKTHVSEYLADLHVLNQLRRHPLRTWHMDRAEYHVVGSVFVPSWYTAKVAAKECGGQEVHEDRLADAVQALRNLQVDKSRLVFISSDTRWSEAFGDELVEFIRAEGSILVTPDRLQSMEDASLEENDVVSIPFKVATGIEAVSQSMKNKTVTMSALLLDRAPTPDVTEVLERRHYARMNPFFFPGGPANLDEDDQQLMRSLREARRVHFPGATNVMSQHETFTDALLHAKFCIVTLGDQHTSEVLYKALASGCVPVVFTDAKTALRSLPFPNSLDWRSMMIFAGSRQCALKNIGATEQWMSDLYYAEGDLAASLEVMRDRGRDTYVESLDMTDTRFVTLLLHEFAHIRSSPTPRYH